MLEVIRRLGLLLWLMAAIVTFMQAPALLLEVRPVDFTKEYEAADSSAKMTLAEYIDQKTEYEIPVQGAEWLPFFQRVNEVLASQASAGDWQKRLSVGWSAGKALFFTPNEPPLKGIYPQLELINKKSLLCYLSLANGGQTQYLAVFSRGLAEVKDSAQAELLYPYRRFSLWLVVAGIAVYVLIPWRRRKPGAIAYPLLGGYVIMMDLAATLLTGALFALPFIVVNGAGRPGVFDPGWIGFTLFCWLASLLGVALYAAAAANAASCIEISSDGLTVGGLWQPQTYMYSGMAAFHPFAPKLPAWARVLVWLLMILFWLTRQINSALAMKRLLRQEANGIIINLLDGRNVRIWNNDLPGFERISQALETNGVAQAQI